MARGGSKVAEQMNDDIDRTSHGSRQEQEADGQPEEATKTFKLASSF